MSWIFIYSPIWKESSLFSCRNRMRQSPLLLDAWLSPLYKLLMADGYVALWNRDGKIEVLRRKPAPVQLWPTQIPHGLPWVWIDFLPPYCLHLHFRNVNDDNDINNINLLQCRVCKQVHIYIQFILSEHYIKIIVETCCIVDNIPHVLADINII
jgi:hypothetical protein